MSKTQRYSKYIKPKFKPKVEVEQTASNSLYEINKQIISTSKMEPLSSSALKEYLPKFEDWFNWIIDTYAMLLCHERRDYTIFHLYEKENKNPPAVAAKELLECLINRGDVVSIDLTADKAWEIWIKINDEPFCYYLFRYDDAVIEC